MNNYIKEIIDICKLPFEEVVKDYKIILLGSRAVCITNFIKIIDYNTEKIILKVKKNIVEISGENLKLMQINKGEILIEGNIENIGTGVNGKKNN